MKLFKVFKKKQKKPFNESFFVKEISFPAKVYGTSDILSKVIKVVNLDKPFPQVFLGVGWDSLLNLLEVHGFDASIQDTKEQTSVYDARDLTNLVIGYKKWIEEKR